MSEKPARRPARPESYKLLREIYDDDSVARIYQDRLHDLLYDLADHARAIGMQVRIEAKRSRERVYFQQGSALILRRVPDSIPDEVFQQLDEILRAARGHDFVGAARMSLLETIDAEATSRPYWSGFGVLARRELGRATEGDSKAIDAIPSAVAEDFAEQLAAQEDKAVWLEKRAQFSEEPDLGGVKKIFTFDYPEWGARLTDELLSSAMAVWPRRGGSRPHSKAPTKWEALASMMDGIGLGPITPDSLQDQWVRHRRPYRQLGEPDR